MLYTSNRQIKIYKSTNHDTLPVYIWIILLKGCDEERWWMVSILFERSKIKLDTHQKEMVLIKSHLSGLFTINLNVGWKKYNAKWNSNECSRLFPLQFNPIKGKTLTKNVSTKINPVSMKLIVTCGWIYTTSYKGMYKHKIINAKQNEKNLLDKSIMKQAQTYLILLSIK